MMRYSVYYPFVSEAEVALYLKLNPDLSVGGYATAQVTGACGGASDAIEFDGVPFRDVPETIRRQAPYDWKDPVIVINNYPRPRTYPFALHFTSQSEAGELCWFEDTPYVHVKRRGYLQNQLYICPITGNVFTYAEAAG